MLLFQGVNDILTGKTASIKQHPLNNPTVALWSLPLWLFRVAIGSCSFLTPLGSLYEDELIGYEIKL